MYSYFLLFIGLAILVFGGDILIRGAVSLAERLAIPALIIGLTIVSLGTSAPELFISLQAALAGSGGLAIGNVIGSNIANILLVLGLPALIHETCCEEKGIARSIFVMIGFTILFMFMMWTGTITRTFGIILLVLLLAFLFEQYRVGMKAGGEPEHDYHEDVPSLEGGIWKSIAFLVIGIILLPIGAGFTVSSAQEIALEWGISEEVIGLTIVAIGTSLPELAASMMAVIRGKSSVALGNVVGSNIFNMAAIMGVTATIIPVEVPTHAISIDMWAMFAATLVLAFIACKLRKISRLSGLLMMAAYSIYIVSAFFT